MKIRVDIDVDDNFERGYCVDCPFHYEDSSWELGDFACVLHYAYDECPIQVIDDSEQVLSTSDIIVGLVDIQDNMCHRCTALKNDEYCKNICGKKQAIVDAINILNRGR